MQFIYMCQLMAMRVQCRTNNNRALNINLTQYIHLCSFIDILIPKISFIVSCLSPTSAIIRPIVVTLDIILCSILLLMQQPLSAFI